MNELTESQTAALNVALNEASLVGVDIDIASRRFGVTLAVLALPLDDGPPPADPRIRLDLEPVGRLAVSWRRARWDDEEAVAVPMTVEDLPSVVASFGQGAIYGWEFFDAPEEAFAGSSKRISLDLELGRSAAHTLDLFQEGSDEFLELRVWFDALRISRLEGNVISSASIDEIAAAGKRWWDAMFAGDPRTNAAGIFPAKR